MHIYLHHVYGMYIYRVRYRIVIVGVVDHALDLRSPEDSVSLLPLLCKYMYIPYMYMV